MKTRRYSRTCISCVELTATVYIVMVTPELLWTAFFKNYIVWYTFSEAIYQLIWKGIISTITLLLVLHLAALNFSLDYNYFRDAFPVVLRLDSSDKLLLTLKGFDSTMLLSDYLQVDLPI